MEIYSSRRLKDDGDCITPEEAVWEKSDPTFGLSMQGEQDYRDEMRRRKQAFWDAERKAMEYADDLIAASETCWEKWAREDAEKRAAKEAEQAEWRKRMEAKA